MKFTENFASDAGELMDGILTDHDISPIVFSFIGLDSDEAPESQHGPFDDQVPTVDRMKRCGMYHGETPEL